MERWAICGRRQRLATLDHQEYVRDRAGLLTIDRIKYSKPTDLLKGQTMVNYQTSVFKFSSHINQ